MAGEERGFLICARVDRAKVCAGVSEQSFVNAWREIGVRRLTGKLMALTFQPFADFQVQ
jgi:hypothetical protein